jgi:hypothetical protein
MEMPKYGTYKRLNYQRIHIEAAITKCIWHRRIVLEQ